MAKNKKENKKKAYKNPASTNWGKILIAVLTLAMVGASFAMLVYYIVQMIRG
jgi:hypothetical protein